MTRSLITQLALLTALFLVLAGPVCTQVRQPGTRPPVTRRGTPQGRRTWVPGRYETRQVRVRTPPSTQRVWVAPAYRRSRDRRGNPIQVLLKAGHWKNVRIPGGYKTETRRIWVKGHWKTR